MKYVVIFGLLAFLLEYLKLVYDFFFRQEMIVGQEKMSNLSKSTFENDFLFDFTTMSDVNDWYEVSDTVRSVGKSKAALGIFFI